MTTLLLFYFCFNCFLYIFKASWNCCFYFSLITEILCIVIFAPFFFSLFSSHRYTKMYGKFIFPHCPWLHYALFCFKFNLSLFPLCISVWPIYIVLSSVTWFFSYRYHLLMGPLETFFIKLTVYFISSISIIIIF